MDKRCENCELAEVCEVYDLKNASKLPCDAFRGKPDKIKKGK